MLTCRATSSDGRSRFTLTATAVLSFTARARSVADSNLHTVNMRTSSFHQTRTAKSLLDSYANEAALAQQYGCSLPIMASKLPRSRPSPATTSRERCARGTKRCNISVKRVERLPIRRPANSVKLTKSTFRLPTKRARARALLHDQPERLATADGEDVNPAKPVI